MPRLTAIRVIEAVESRGAYSNIALDAQIRRQGLNPQDAALAAELTYGALRNQSLLDHIAGRWLRRPPTRLHPVCRAALRVGAYQILLVDRVPHHAAVCETVAAVKRINPRFTGLVNAVLRRIADSSSSLRAELELPICSAGDLARRYSLPELLAESLVSRWGLEEAIEYARAIHERPPVTLRVRHPQDRQAVIEQLAGQGVFAEPTPYSPAGVRIVSAGAPDRLRPVIEDRAVVQDEGAQLVGWFTGAESTMTVADLCAGRGGKTFHLSDMMGDRGLILATDVSRNKLQVLERTAAGLGIGNIRVCFPSVDGTGAAVPDDLGVPTAPDGSDSIVPDGSDSAGPDGSDSIVPDGSDSAGPLEERNGPSSRYRETTGWQGIGGAELWSDWPPVDLVLIDAPCSGAGVLRRHPEIRWRLGHSRIEELISLQEDMLDRAVALVRPEGHLVYSVCSDLHREGPGQVENFLTRHPGFSRSPPPDNMDYSDLVSSQGDLTLYPHRHQTDGFFAARLKRVS